MSSSLLTARIMAQIPKEEQLERAAALAESNGRADPSALDKRVRGGAFDSQTEKESPFGHGKGEGMYAL